MKKNEYEFENLTSQLMGAFAILALVVVLIMDVDGVSAKPLGYQFPKGDYVNKRLTGTLIGKIKGDLGKEATGVLLQAAYTAWCLNDEGGTISSYTITSSLIAEVVAGGAENLYTLIHTPGRYPGCWGKDGYQQQVVINKDYVEFYQSLDLLYREATGVIPLGTSVYKRDCGD